MTVKRVSVRVMGEEEAKRLQQRCSICGSRFAERKCYFCQRQVCNSCIAPLDVAGDTSTTKCLTCYRNKVTKLGILTLLKRNAFIIAILFGFWMFTIFPIPFLQLAGLEVDATMFQPVLIATAAMAIPFVFMFIAWQRRAPRGSQ
ncbi:MAG TPA: hypothetical protein VJP79_03910 [Nitrososphaera sp.]|nr:hypothetical protein [Nitrososphaera sp.]